MYFPSSPLGPTTYYQPQTPSPLRTSRNANLMMPPPTYSFSQSPTSPLETKSSPLAPSSTFQNQNSQNTTGRCGSTPSTFSFPNSTSTPNQIHTPTAKPTFSSRALSSTPQSTLSIHLSAAKSRRRTLFRDQIRQRRDDARYDVRGDQVLRMDWVRERKEWEERLRRSGPEVLLGELDEEEGGLDEDMGCIGNDGNGEFVPLTEEEEVEALTGYLVEREKESSASFFLGDGQDIGPDADCDPENGNRGSHYASDEEEYDQLFMEFVKAGQKHGDFEQGFTWQEPQQQQQHHHHHQQWQQNRESSRCQDQPSSSMDLS